MLDTTKPSELRLVARAMIGFARYPYAEDLLKELGSDAWALVLEHGPAEDRAFLGPLFDAVRSWLQLKNAIWAIKLRGFLHELLRASKLESTTFEERGGEAEWTGEAVLVLLDSLDDTDKARILGRLFRAYLAGDLDRRELVRLARKVARGSVLDMIALKGLPERVPEISVCEDLERAGLMRLKVRKDAPVSAEDFEINVHGRILVRLMLDMETLSAEIEY